MSPLEATLCVMLPLLVVAIAAATLGLGRRDDAGAGR
jgi:hypothetical protein